MEYAYSGNDEDWTDFDSLMDRVNSDNAAGTVVEIYKGEKYPATHADFVNADRLIEDFQERAYDEGGEFTEDYLSDVSESQKEELCEMVVAWLDKNAKSPQFYHVRNSKKETVVAEEI